MVSWFLSHLRILPITAAVAVLVLVVRVGELTRVLDAGDGRANYSGLSGGAIAAEPEAGPETVPEAAPGPVPEYTLEEVAILQDLAARRLVLVERERDLALREGLLEAAENRIDAKIGELETLRAGIEKLVRQFDEQEEAEVQSLVKIYETMKAKDAARILGQIEMDVLLSIMERMKERSSAPVLAQMDADRARDYVGAGAPPRGHPSRQLAS